MDDATWKQLTQTFLALLKGARFDANAPRATGKQPPLIAGAFSPDDSLVAFSGGGRIPCRAAIWVARVPGLETGTMIHGHQGVHALAWHARTGLLASVSNDYTAVMWELERGDNLFVCGGDAEAPIVKGHVAFSDDAIYVGETETFQGHLAKLLRVSLSTGKRETLCELGKGLAVTALAVDAKTDHWAIVRDSFHYSGEATLLVARGGGIEEKKLGKGALELRWRDGELLCIELADSDDGRVEVRVDAQRWTIDARSRFDVGVSSDGRLIAFASPDRRHASAMRLADGQPIWSIELPREADQVFWSESGRLLAIAGSDVVVLVDALKGTILATTEPPAWFRSGL